MQSRDVLELQVRAIDEEFDVRFEGGSIIRERKKVEQYRTVLLAWDCSKDWICAETDSFDRNLLVEYVALLK